MPLWVGKNSWHGHRGEYALSWGSNPINITVFPSVCLSDCLSVIIVLQLPQLLFENRTSSFSQLITWEHTHYIFSYPNCSFNVSSIGLASPINRRADNIGSLLLKWYADGPLWSMSTSPFSIFLCLLQSQWWILFFNFNFVSFCPSKKIFSWKLVRFWFPAQ